MRRRCRFALISGALALAVPAGAQGQAVERPAPRFTVGVYGGAAYTSEWYESRVLTDVQDQITRGGGYGFGATPAVGGAATLFLSPALGLRVHYGYLPSEIPQADDGDRDDADLTLNNHLYDVSLVLRPWAGSEGGLLAQTYLFLGGGGLTADVAREGPADACEPLTLERDACLPLEPEWATVGQGTAGIGWDVFPLGPLGVFLELGAHVYDSPVHADESEPFDEAAYVAEDRYAVTGRAVLGLKLGLGAVGQLAQGAVPVTPTPAPPPTTAPVPPAAPPPPVEEEIGVCVVEGTALVQVPAIFRPETGDTLVAATREPFADAYPALAPGYATSAPWYVDSQPIEADDQEYVKFGEPRIVTPVQLQRVGEYQGVGLFAEAGTAGPYEVLYLPVRPGCEFQPYRLRGVIRPRG